MDEPLSDDQSQLRESAARLCRDRGGAKRARRLRDAGAALDETAWAAIRDAGWLGIVVPEARGGLGLGAAELYIVLEEIGRHTIFVPMIETAASAWALGNADRLVLPAFDADGWNFRGAASMLEAEEGGGVLRLKGSVPAVPYAAAAEEFLVLVQAAGEALLCRVPRPVIEPTPNVDGSSAARVVFDGVTVEPARVVAGGEKARDMAARMADLLALGTAIELMGVAETALAMTLEHLKTRRQFGHPLGSFQALQHRIVDNFVDLELNRSLLHRICLAWDDGGAVPALAAAAKTRAARIGNEIARTAVQFHGAIGYTDEHDIGIYFKRALVLAARYGNELTQSQRFARLTMDEA